jgi:hypothetical protein
MLIKIHNFSGQPLNILNNIFISCTLDIWKGKRLSLVWSEKSLVYLALFDTKSLPGKHWLVEVT